jgi:creatinine amidohydrolase
MPLMESDMHYGDMTYQEIRERAASGWLAVVPTGCTEQQGPHLPVDFDTWFAETVCLAAARVCAGQGANVLVLPVLPFGPTPEHRNYGYGFIDLPQDLHESIVMVILQSLAAQGFRRMVVWRGCGQHNLKRVVDNFNCEQAGQAHAVQPEMPYAGIMRSIAPGIPGGHADSFCTSIALYLRPELVRVDKIPEAETTPVDWNDPALDFSRYSKSGVIGDPTRISLEFGAKLWNETVANVARIFTSSLTDPSANANLSPSIK